MATIGCKSDKPTPAANQAQAPAPAGQTPDPGKQPLPADNQPQTQMSVDDLVAPVALYPDQLLGQLLVASTVPQEVLDLGNWLIQNQNLQGDAVTNAVKQAGFSNSAQYLALFPQVVDNMCQEMDWTNQLGEAFKNNQKGVMEAVQRKRVEAQKQGNLQSSSQMTVDTKTENGQQYIEIKAPDPQVVYVPQYNPVTIYNTPAAAAPAPVATTTTEEKSGVSTGTAVAIGLLSFGAGMAIGSAIHHDDYYPYPSWGYGGMYYGGRPYYPPPYRAPVYAGYRPAYGYHPPSNYHWSQYNRNVNVNVNNNNYYNRFNNKNRTVNNRTANNNASLGARNNNNNNRLGNSNPGVGRGSSTYQGARPNAGRNEKPGASMANVNPNAAGRGGRNQPAGRDVSRPNTGNAYSPGGAQARTGNRGGDRGYGNAASSNARASAATQNRPTNAAHAQARGNSGGAFSGNSGKSDRSASSRGRSSMGAQAKGGHQGSGNRKR
jgi:Protein of unknown function (DUF3300)